MPLSERTVYALGGLLAFVALTLPWVARRCGLITSRVTHRAQALRPPLVVLPGGTFFPGTPDGKDRRAGTAVAVGSFAMCQTEVTQGQWEAVMGRNPSGCPGCDVDFPVQNVSWLDVVHYLNELTRQENLMRAAGEQLTECYTITADEVTWKTDCTGYRLPTEAESEYAAQANVAPAFDTWKVSWPVSEWVWDQAPGQSILRLALRGYLEASERSQSRWDIGLRCVRGAR